MIDRLRRFIGHWLIEAGLWVMPPGAFTVIDLDRLDEFWGDDE